MNSKISFSKIKAPRLAVFSLLVLSLVGFADAFYLCLVHYFNLPLNCSIFTGCEKVLNSQYAVVLGVPVALFGVLFYAVIFFLTLAYLESGNVWFIKLLIPVATLGFLASFWFLYLQLAVLRALCPYCLVSAASSTLLFLLGLYLLKLSKEVLKLG